MQLGSKRIYTGRVINLDVDRVRFPDDSTGELELIRHPGAAGVLPFLSDPEGADPTILLIQQYRYAADGPLYEIPAGRLDKGEDPAACAQHELLDLGALRALDAQLEEVGVTAGRLERLTTIWTTPGFTDERIHLFWAADLSSGKHAREPDEFIEVVPTPVSKALTLIRDGVISDAKTVVGILYMAGFILKH